MHILISLPGVSAGQISRDGTAGPIRVSLRLGLGVKGPVPPWAAVPPLVSPLLEFLPWAQKEQGKWVHNGKA